MVMDIHSKDTEHLQLVMVPSSTILLRTEKFLRDTAPLHLLHMVQCHRDMEQQRLLPMDLPHLLPMELPPLPLTEPQRPLTEPCHKDMQLLPLLPTEPLPLPLMAQSSKDIQLHRNPQTRN